MRIVAVVGFSETGKTRLIVRLIGELKGRGLRVAAVSAVPTASRWTRKVRTRRISAGPARTAWP